MLSSANRLHNSRDVRRVLSKGARLIVGGVRVSHMRNRVNVPRMTVVISAKTLKSAAARNHLKRRIRVTLRQFVAGHQAWPIDAVFTVMRAPTASAVLEQCSAALQRLTKL